MTSLSPEAHAIIGGYHADPFRYLGRHDEGDAKSFAHSCPEPRGGLPTRRRREPRSSLSRCYYKKDGTGTPSSPCNRPFGPTRSRAAFCMSPGRDDETIECIADESELSTV
jgi:hypothetical protein